MKKSIGSIGAKISAIIISYISFVVIILAFIGSITMIKCNFYTQSKSKVEETIFSNMASSEVYRVYNMYDSQPNIHGINYITSYYSDKNFYFTIKDSEGIEICSNYGGEDVIAYYTNEHLYIIEYEEHYGELQEVLGEQISIIGYIPKKMDNLDIFYIALKIFDIAYSIRYTVFLFAFISLIVFVLSLCFLYCSAGHRKGFDGIKLNAIDRIPFDIYTAIIGIFALFVLSVFDNFLEIELFEVLVCILCATLLYFLILAYTISFATRLKTNTLIKNNIIYKATLILVKGFKNCFKVIKYLFLNLSLVKKTFLLISVIVFFEFILILIGIESAEVMLVLWLISTVLLSTSVLLVVIAMQKIKEGGEKIALGDLSHKIDTTYMFYDFKSFAESLNNINLGLQSAVNEKMKSERFKTELITNVSHDIKTPLTCMINYVDLIKKEEIENETIKQYVEVLDRQSVRLKKLIEDLVEASKASTGNITVNLTECDVGALLSQTIGEFDERLGRVGLIPVLSQPEKQLKIKADGRHLWRIFENLMSNICKYSQENTRVYIEACEKDGKVFITFKNISKYELNISSSELFERFVMGDASRNTEGSGLGLTISKSLVEIQNGQIELVIDGDLFKVVLIFNSI